MTDLPTPPASVPPPTDPAPRSRRVDWRPKLRWFGAEYLIVVLGVLTAVALNAWWQGRQDAAREQQYLHQLVADLEETEGNFERSEASLARRDASAAKLLRAFRSASIPSADSVTVWSVQASWMSIPGVVTGTAVALVETGDLNLIRDDSLRSSITQYIDRVDQQLEYMASNAEAASPHVVALSERVDYAHARIVRRSPAEIDSAARTDPLYPIPEAPRQAFAPVDVEALLQDREAYTAIWSLWQARRAMAANRRSARGATVALREQIEAELDR